MLLRGGNFATAYVYPKELRATRDLLRRRTHLVRLKAQTLTHLQIVNHQHNFDPFEKKIRYKTNRIGIADRFDDPSVKASVGLDVRLADFLHDEIRKLELHIEQSAKVDDPQSLFQLQTIQGVGRILAMTMLYEIHDIKRFPTVGQFLSYCRLIKGSHTSAGKSYGSPGKKIGNAHLKWAFSEAVPLMKRCCPAASTFVDRIEKKRGKARAFSYLAVKLGRAVYCLNVAKRLSWTACYCDGTVKRFAFVKKRRHVASVWWDQNLVRLIWAPVRLHIRVQENLRPSPHQDC